MSLLEPVCMNKPFKGEMRQLYNDWMAEGDKPLTSAGNLNRPSIPVVIRWVKTMLECLPVEMVCKAYLNCGIYNKMNSDLECF